MVVFMCFVVFLLGLISTTYTQKQYLYIGSGGCDADYPHCTPPSGSFLYVTEFDSNTGEITIHSKLHDLLPLWLKAHPNNKYLYSITPHGIAAFRVQRRGSLSFINSIAADPSVYLEICPTGHNLFSASSGRGSISIYPIETDGSLQSRSSHMNFHGHGPNPTRQASPHPHAINLDPRSAGSFAYVPDLALDTVFTFHLSNQHNKVVFENTTFTSSAIVHPGSGPRHIAFHPLLPILYVLSEMASTVSVYYYTESTGHISLPPLQTISTLPSHFAGWSKASEILITSDAKWLLTSNRGFNYPSNSITIFNVDDVTGILIKKGLYDCKCIFPTSMILNPTENFLVIGGQDSSNVVVMGFDLGSGILTNTGVNLNVSTPVAFAFIQE